MGFHIKYHLEGHMILSREVYNGTYKTTLYFGGIDTTPLGKENRKPKSPKANCEPKKVDKKQSFSSHQPRSLEEAANRKVTFVEIISLCHFIYLRT
ncbi:hypothetical protein SK128_004101 [Halocaridina rubra]|uniref:Uncharacterized protein n=1 Tax=Halocaridina rubra TaxID=373956 RepID=A0AAN8WR22_HALRR